MAVKQTELEELAQIIIKKIKDEFSGQYMSHNLVDTIIVYEEQDRIRIEIPAEVYNMFKFQTQGVVIPYHNGKSYASKLDEEGSSFKVYPNGTIKGSYWVRPRNHIGFLDKIINESIFEWTGIMSSKYQVDSINTTTP